MDEVEYISISRTLSLQTILSWCCSMRTPSVWEEEVHTVPCQFEGGLNSRMWQRKASCILWLMAILTMLISEIRFPWRMRVMGFFIESPLLAEASSLTRNDHSYSFLLIPPCEIRIYRISTSSLAELWARISSLCSRFFQLAELSTLQTAVGLSARLIMWFFFFQEKGYFVSKHCLFPPLFLYFILVMSRPSSPTNIYVVALHCITQ